MRRILLLIFLGLKGYSTYAQDDSTLQLLQDVINRNLYNGMSDTIKRTWVKGGSINLTATQGSLNNWAAGGDKFSMSINSYINYYLFYRKGKAEWDNNIDFNFGYLQSTSAGSRKNDDRFDLTSKYGHQINKRWFLTALFDFRTQLFDGYSYSATDPVFSSTFLSPAYALVAAGFDYKPSANFSAFISPATSRLVIVADQFIADQGLYGVDTAKHISNQFGAYLTVNWTQPLGKNILYKGRIDLFSNYLQNPSNLNVFMTNFINFKINKYLSATYSLDLIYDDKVRLFGKTGKSAALQSKSLMGLGFAMKLK